MRKGFQYANYAWILTEDYVKGFKYCLEEGKQEKVMEFACVMKQDGIPIEQIIDYSDFSSEEIERL